MARETRFIIVKIVLTDKKGEKSEDYHMLEVPQRVTNEQVTEQIIEHFHRGHSQYAIDATLYHPDDLPPDILADKTTLSLFLS